MVVSAMAHSTEVPSHYEAIRQKNKARPLLGRGHGPYPPMTHEDASTTTVNNGSDTSFGFPPINLLEFLMVPAEFCELITKINLRQCKAIM